MARRNKFIKKVAKKTKTNEIEVISTARETVESHHSAKIEKALETTMTESREKTETKETKKKKIPAIVKGYIALAILIGVILVGLFGLFTNLPQIAIGDLQVFSEDIIKQLVKFFNGEDTDPLEAEKITKLSNKLQVMGYDFESFGFGLAEKLEDKTVEKNGETTLEKGKSKQIKTVYNVGRQYLTSYIAANTSTYLKAGYNYKEYFAGDKNIYSTGLIQLDTPLQQYDVDFTINEETRRLQPYRGDLIFKEWTNLTSFDLKLWAAEYGRPLELFFALHTATMMPDLTYHIATDSVFNTKVHVYAQEVKINYKVTNKSDMGNNEVTLYFPYIGYVSNHWFYNTIDFAGGATGLRNGSYKRDGTLKSLGYKTTGLTNDTLKCDITSYSPSGKLIRQVAEPQIDMTKPNKYIQALFLGGEGQVSNKYENGQKYSYSGKYYKYDGSMETARKIAIAKALDEKIDKTKAKPKGLEYLVKDAYVKDESKKVTINEAKAAINNVKITYKWHSSSDNHDLSDITITDEEKEEYLIAKTVDETLVGSSADKSKYSADANIADGPMVRKSASFSNTTAKNSDKFNGRHQVAYDSIMILSTIKTLEGEYTLRCIKYLMANLGFASTDDLSLGEKNVLIWPVDNGMAGNSTLWSTSKNGKVFPKTKNGEEDKSATDYGMTIENVSEDSVIVAPGDGKIVSLKSLRENNDAKGFLAGIEGYDDKDTVVIKLDKLSEETIKILDYRFKNESVQITDDINSNLATSLYIIISNIEVKANEGQDVKRGDIIGYPKNVEKDDAHPNGTDPIYVKMIKENGELVENLEEYVSSKYTKTDEEGYKELVKKDEEGSKLSVPLVTLDGDYIVKTDMAGACPVVTDKALLEQGLRKWLSSTPKQVSNALSILDAMLKYQEQYKVNLVFVYAIFKLEQGMGTAHGAIPISFNNWGSVKARYGLPNSDLRTWRRFSSTTEMVRYEMYLFAEKGPYFKEKKYTVKTIAPVYCDVKWGKTCIHYMQEIYKALGIDAPLNYGDGSSPFLKQEGYDGGAFILKKSGDGFSDVTKVSFQGGYIYYRNYKQFKGSYKMVPYSNSNIWGAGCGPASLSIILSGYGIDAHPGIIGKAMGGYHNGGTTGSKLKKCLEKYGIQAKVVHFGNSVSQVKQVLVEHLRTGRPISLSVHNNSLHLTSGGHLVAALAVNKDASKILISNPSGTGKKTGWVNANLLADAATHKYAVLVLTNPKPTSVDLNGSGISANAVGESIREVDTEIKEYPTGTSYTTALSNTLFIGDSYIEGLKGHMGSSISGAYYAGHSGKTPEDFVKNYNSWVETAFNSGKKYDRIIVYLGVNQYQTSDTQRMKELIDTIKMKHPGIPIYINEVMNLGKPYKYYSSKTKQMAEFNEGMQTYCDYVTDVYYINASANLVVNGYLTPCTEDGIHIKGAEANKRWAQNIADEIAKINNN